MRLNGQAALTAALWLVSSVAHAQSAPTAPTVPPGYGTQVPAFEPPPEPSLVRQNSVGLRLSIAPGVFIPANGGSAGFTLGVVAGYGIDVGPVIVTPGVMVQGSWGSNLTIYSGLGGARVTLPLGNFGPFVEGALGYGNVSGPAGYSKGGLAIRVGGGFIFFFSRSFALGLTVDYDTITDTPYQTWIIAPTLLISF